MARNFQIQPEDNINVDQENERTIELHINQNIKELQEEERIDFNRLSRNNPLIAPVTVEEVKPE